MVADVITSPDLFERAIIGCLLVCSDARDIAFKVDEELFNTPQGAHAYTILRKAALSGNPFGYDTATAAIKSSSGVSDAYGAHDNAVDVYLSSCVEAAEPAESWPTFVNQLKLIYAKRVINGAIDKAQVASFLASEPDRVVMDALDPVVSAATRLKRVTGKGDYSMGEVVADYLEDYKRGDDPIPFCQDKLNSVGGFRPGNMVFLGAYTGQLKSFWAIDLALETAKRGKRVRFYTLEMSRLEVVERIIGMLDGGRSFTIEDLVERKVDKALLEPYIRELEALPLSIVDGGCSANKVLTDCIALGDAQPDVVVIDHMHLLRYGRDDLRMGIDDALRDFKAFAVENRIAFVLLAQLSRPENRQAPGKPTIYMAKESGGIEQIADYFLFIHQHKEKEAGVERKWRSMWVEKQRQGEAPQEFEVEFRRYRIR